MAQSLTNLKVGQRYVQPIQRVLRHLSKNNNEFSEVDGNFW